MSLSNAVRFIIVTFILLLLFLTLSAIVFVPESDKEFLTLFVQSLKEFLLIIIGFYFGSSSGSAVKTQLLANKEAKEE